MAEAARMPEMIPFDPPAPTGNNCGDMLALSKHKLLVSIDQIAFKNPNIHKGWFGKLDKQTTNGQKRKLLFPKNYQKLDKWLTEDCNCAADQERVEIYQYLILFPQK